MTKKEHSEMHRKLHMCLDELLTDFIMQTEKLPSKTTIMELLEWSNKQIQNPTER